MRVPILAWPAATLWLVLWFVGPTETYRPPAPPDWVLSVRDNFAESVARFGGDGADLVPGLVLGDTSAIPDSLTRAMRVTSLAHLTAVSGANCAVIVATVFGIAALFGAGIWLRVVLSGGALVTFVVLVGAEPSVIRASIMSALALIALALGRPSTGLALLSAAVLISLTVWPALSHNIGFALSVSATLGLLLLMKPLSDVFARWMPRKLAVVVAVPVAAQISVQPLLLVFQPSIPTFGVLANALADPLAPIATIAGLLSLVATPLPAVSVPLAGLAWCAGSVIAWIARTGAGLPFASIPWPVDAVGIALALACTVLVAWALIARRRVMAVTSGLIAAVSLSTTIGGGVVAWASAPDDWSIAQCDVGQGDALVLRDGDDTAIIDTGRDEVAFRNCLQKLGVNHVTLLVLTHFDIDHAGAYTVVLGRVDTVLHGPTDGIADEITLRELARAGATLVDASRGMIGRLGEWDWKVLWPTPSLPVEPGNPSSVVLQLASTTARLPGLIDLGDLPSREQELMVGLGGIGRVDVVKVSHHGSRDQFTGLYEKLRAGVALVGVGAGNEYGHPTDESLAMLRAIGSVTVRTDTRGIALVGRGDGGSVRVWTERAGWPAVN